MIVSARMLYIIYLQLPISHWFHELSYACNVRTSIPMPTVFDPIIAFILLLMLLFHYYHHYKTVATDKPLRTSLFLGAAELTTHLLRLINILWLPLYRLNKFGFYFPRRLLRSPILVGHQSSTSTRLPSSWNITYWYLFFHNNILIFLFDTRWLNLKYGLRSPYVSGTDFTISYVISH
jgi:hypothetical protein